MADNKVKLSGTRLEVDAKSTALARELKAQLEGDLYAIEGRGVSGWILKFGNAVRNVTHAIGRGTFEGIAWVLMAVGIVIAYVSWSRLLPVKDMAWLIGLVGAAIVIGIKVSAGRQAERLNERDAAQRYSAQAREIGDEAQALRHDAQMTHKQGQADFWKRVVLIGLAADAVAAFAFAAAITQDAETGKIDYEVQIAALEREAKDLGYEAEAMPRPADDIGLLTDDLMRALKAPAYNNEGKATPLSRAVVTGWGVDAAGLPLAEPDETAYCLPGGKYASYVERYCEDIIEMHRLVRQKQAWLDKLAAKQAKLDEAETLRQSRPEAASGLAVGKLFGKFGVIFGYLPSVFLMAVILLVMVYSSFVAKRDLEGD